MPLLGMGGKDDMNETPYFRMTEAERTQALIDTFCVVNSPPVEYRYEDGRIVTQYGSIGFRDRDMTPCEASEFLAMLPNAGDHTPSGAR